MSDGRPMRSLSSVIAILFAASCHRSPPATVPLVGEGGIKIAPDSGVAGDQPDGESSTTEETSAEARIRAIDAEYAERLTEQLRLGGPYERGLVLQRFMKSNAPKSAIPTLVELLDQDAPVPLGTCSILLSRPRSSIGGQGTDYLWAECAHAESTGETSNAWRARRVLLPYQRDPELGEAIARRTVEHPPSAPAFVRLLREGGPIGTFLPAFLGALKDARTPDAEAALLQVILATGVSASGDAMSAALVRTTSPDATVRRRAALIVVALSAHGELTHPKEGADALGRALALLGGELRDPSTEGVAADMARARMDSRAPTLLVPALVYRLQRNPRDVPDVLAVLASAMEGAEPALPLILRRLAAPEPTPLLPELCRVVEAIGERAKAAKPLLLGKVQGAGYDLSAVLSALARIEAPLSPAEWQRVLKAYEADCGDAHSPVHFGLTREQHCNEAEGALVTLAQVNHFPYNPSASP